MNVFLLVVSLKAIIGDGGAMVVRIAKDLRPHQPVQTSTAGFRC